MESAKLIAAFEARTLPKTAWTHDAHVTVAAVLTYRLGRSEALMRLRDLIPAYNLATGGENSDTAGYHDTLTVYFTGAAAQAVDGARSEAEAVVRALASPLMTREAPLRHWSRDLLFSVPARRGFVAPDVAPPEFALA